MDDARRTTAAGESESRGSHTYDIRDAVELDAENLAEAMKSGRFEVRVDGALSEWGSRLESLVNKLERAVMQWHEPGRSKTLAITFSEPEEELAPGENASDGAAPPPA